MRCPALAALLLTTLTLFTPHLVTAEPVAVDTTAASVESLTSGKC